MRADGIELMIVITTTFAQAIAGSGPAVNIVGVLTCLRFIMGIGIGGDYPLSAVIASEFAATRSRGRLMTAVFASQGWGYLGKTSSHTQWPLLTAFSFYYCGTNRCVCIQNWHFARLNSQPRAYRLLLADPHWCRLCPGRRRALFPAHHPGDSTIHYGY